MSTEKSPKFLYQFDGEKEIIFITKEQTIGSESMELRPGVIIHFHKDIVTAVELYPVNIFKDVTKKEQTEEPVSVVKEKRTYKKRAEKVEVKEKRKYNKKPKLEEAPKRVFREDEDDRDFFHMVEKGDNFTEGEVAILLKRGLTIPEIEIAYPKRSYQEIEKMVRSAKETYDLD